MEGLLMPFVNETKDFTLGFECGIIWQKIQAGEPIDQFLFHVSNARQVAMICKHFDVRFDIKNVDETWNELTIKKEK